MLTWEDELEYMPYASVVGRSRRSPAIPGTTEAVHKYSPVTSAGGSGSAVTGSVRSVRRLRQRPAGRGPSPVGPNPVR